MIESTSIGTARQEQVDLEESSMRTLEGGRMDAPTTGVCGRAKGSNGRGVTSPGRGGGSRGGGVAGSQLARGAAAPPRILPPCRVCGLTATGFHYGANTCEACKVRDSKSNLSNIICMCEEKVIKTKNNNSATEFTV